jgi:short-subunit dehydrogenase
MNELFNIKDKVVAITGSTGGLGSEICHHLASLGANLILINRNLPRSNKQKHQLEEIYPNIKIEIVSTDLANLKSVKQAVEILKQK